MPGKNDGLVFSNQAIPDNLTRYFTLQQSCQLIDNLQWLNNVQVS